MKKLIATSMVLPGAALAHGGHAPLPAAAHEVSHAGPILAAFVIAVAVGLAIVQRWRS